MRRKSRHETFNCVAVGSAYVCVGSLGVGVGADIMYARIGRWVEVGSKKVQIWEICSSERGGSSLTS